MITIFNRRELFLTYSMSERVRICDILSANGIDYHLKTVNTTASTAGGSRRSASTSIGLNMDYAYEYHIYVRKQDYDYAVHLISKR